MNTRLFSDAETFALLSRDVVIVEIHADGQEELREGVQLLFEPDSRNYIILRDGVPFCLVGPCEQASADFRLQAGDIVLYLQFYREDDEIVEFGSQDEALDYVRWLSLKHFF
jgi:hypothetical protein